MTDLIKQPTAAPTRKVTAAAIWGCIATCIIAGIKAFRPDLADSVGPMIPIAAPLVTGLIAAYITHESA